MATCPVGISGSKGGAGTAYCYAVALSGDFVAVNLVVAVTDGDWFEMLRPQPELSEVNFWAPSPASFRALQPGELFLFKLHAPRPSIFRYTSSRCQLV